MCRYLLFEILWKDNKVDETISAPAIICNHSYAAPNMIQALMRAHSLLRGAADAADESQYDVQLSLR